MNRRMGLISFYFLALEFTTLFPKGAMVADFNSNLYNVSSVTQIMNTTTNTTEDVTTTTTFDDIVGSMKIKSVKLTLVGSGQMKFDSLETSFCASRNGNLLWINE